MRLIGHLDSEASAQTLGDYLLAQDIRNLVEPDSGGWAVWVYSEDQIQAGEKALASYLQNPADSKFRVAKQAAAALKERERQDQTTYEKRVRGPERIWRTSAVGPVTLGLIIVSIAVTVLATINMVETQTWLALIMPLVERGQIWRLITPIFIHFDVMHILFDMWWLSSLGTLIETRQSSIRMAMLVLVIAVGSNVGQYYYSGPGFGGMSGVDYGLFGYIWIRGQCDPASGLFLPPMTVPIMLVWFVLCLTGVMGDVANVCHAVGLLMGMIMGGAPMAKRFAE